MANTCIEDVQAEHFRELLNKGETLEIKVNGYCMWPFVNNGELVHIKKVDYKDIHMGELVLTYVHQRFFCHRVFVKRSNFIRTKADALIGLDKKVSPKDILGKVVARNRNGSIKRVDGLFARGVGCVIAWATLFVSPFYPFLRRVKKVLISK